MADEARTRAPRAQDVAQERRRRQPGTLDRMDHLKLAIPDEIRAAHPDHTFYWAKDTAQRIHALTVKDDWDRVPGVDPIPDGVEKSGAQVNLVLLKKRTDYWQEDQRAKDAARKDEEKSILRTAPSDPNSNPEAVTYVPEGNSITRG